MLDKLPYDKIYDDGLSPTVKELGKLLHKTVKAGSFLFAPVEYIAAHRSRWEKYLKKIDEKVPKENLTNGHPQIVIPSLEGLNLAYDNTLLSEMFINLLANSINKKKQDLAHPAFPNIINQLSHDEAFILFLLKKKKYSFNFKYLYNSSTKQPEVTDIEFPLHVLLYQKNFSIYTDHLCSLNLLTLNPKGAHISVKDKNSENSIGQIHPYEMKLSKFGELFAQSCIPDEFKDLNI